MTDVLTGTLAATFGYEQEPAVEQQSEAQPFTFDDNFQRQIVALTLRDGKFLARTRDVLTPKSLGQEAWAFLVHTAQTYFDTYRCGFGSPATLANVAKEQMDKARLSEPVRKEIVGELRECLKTSIADADYVADKVGEFAHNQAVQQAMLEGFNLIEKGDMKALQQTLEKAFKVGVSASFENYDFFGSIGQRTSYRKELASGVIKREGITTGIKKLDSLLWHRGWGRRELTALMAGPKRGKSTALGFFSLRATLAGFNTLYVTCEVASRVIADRMDSCLSEIPMMDIEDRLMEIDGIVKQMADIPHRGRLCINEFPSGTLTPRMLKRLIENYRSEGIKFDLIAVDYADIMAPDMRTTDAIENSKQVWLGLRAIASEEDAAVLTATQTNREGAKSDTARAEDVAEDFNKVRIADLVISINSTDEERAKNEARLYFAASRNQVGDFSVHIKQDMKTMRFITGMTNAA